MTDEKPYTEEPHNIAMADLIAGWRVMDRRTKKLEKCVCGPEEPFAVNTSFLGQVASQTHDNSRELEHVFYRLKILEQWASARDEKQAETPSPSSPIFTPDYTDVQREKAREAMKPENLLETLEQVKRMLFTFNERLKIIEE